MSQRNSQLQSSQGSPHHDTKCHGCGRTTLAKSGGGCSYCGSSSVQRGDDEITRKAFGLDDNDLIKGG